jgi:hypothetical protein
MMCGKLDGKAAGYETKDRPEGLGRSFAGHWMAALQRAENVEVMVAGGTTSPVGVCDRRN